jgi:hypothetical protein
MDKRLIYTLFILGLVIICVLSLSCGSCCPPPTEECTTTIFSDNFEADAVGNSPSTSPAGDPADDAIVLPGASASYIHVINSGPHGSRAVEIARGSSGDVILGCITGGGPNSSGIYIVEFRAYSGEESGLVPPMTVRVKSPDGQTALRLIVDDGNYRLVSGTGSETLSVGYTVNTVDKIEIQVDMDESEISVSINGTNVASDKPFLESEFTDLSELSFQYPPAILEAWGKYIVDDIKICK